MKTFDYYLNEVAKEEGYLEFSTFNMVSSEILKITREANKRYTTAAIKEHLSRAAENARAYDQVPRSYCTCKVLKESITDIDIKLP